MPLLHRNEPSAATAPVDDLSRNPLEVCVVRGDGRVVHTSKQPASSPECGAGSPRSVARGFGDLKEMPR
jgi:hypothetical protein